MIVGSDAQRIDSGRCKKDLILLLMLFVLLLLPAATSNSALPLETVSATISLINSKADDFSNVAIWLEPLSGKPRLDNDERLSMHQRVKEFFPHVLIATVGQQVDFPNDDPFQHNVFSSSEVKKFDLGIFQSGQSRGVMFTRPGIVPIYCNIHPQMEGFVIVLQTPFYGLSDEKGDIQIKNVPQGSYRFRVWHEMAKSETLENLSKQIMVGNSGANLGAIKIDEGDFVPLPHKDKEGGDYNPYPIK